MKVYWLTSKFGKHFFRLTELEIIKEVENRNKPDPLFDAFVEKYCPDKEPYNYSWNYTAEEIPDDQFGICINELPRGTIPKVAWQDDCSVGKIRKMRSGTRYGMEDTLTCVSCPYFLSRHDLDDKITANYKKP